MVGTVIATFNGLVPKYFGSGNAVQVNGIFPPAGAAACSGGLGAPIWTDGYSGASVAYDVNANLLDAYFLQTLENQSGNFAFTSEQIQTPAPVSYYGGAFGMWDNMLGAGVAVIGANCYFNVFDYVPGNRYTQENALSLASPAWIATAALGFAGCYTLGGIKYFLQGLDASPVPSGQGLLANSAGATLQNVWGGAEPGTSPQAVAWTDGAKNYICVSGASSLTQRAYIAECDTLGNEIARNYIQIADPNYDQYLSNSTFHAVAFQSCSKGFYATVYPLPPNQLNRQILLISPDGLKYTVYNCVALDQQAADTLTAYLPFTTILVWGLINVNQTYIDDDDNVYVASYSNGGSGAPLWLFKSPTIQQSAAPTVSQAFGACWPCGLTSRGTH
jgi:hypothetical protein